MEGVCDYCLGGDILVNGMMHNKKMDNKGLEIGEGVMKENTKASNPRKYSGNIRCYAVLARLNIIYASLKQFHLIP